MGNKWTSEKKASPQEASKKKPPQAPPKEGMSFSTQGRTIDNG